MIIVAPELGMPVLPPKGPYISKPHRGQQIELRFLRTAIPGRDLDQNVFRRRLGIFHKHVEIAVIIEHARVQQLVFRVASFSLPIFLDELRVRVGRLGIFIQVLHVGMRGRRIEVEVVLLYIFAMVAFISCEAEQTLFKDRIAPVPKRQSEAYPLVTVADPPNPIFSPAIRARTCMVVRKIFPGRPMWTVIFPDGTPLPLGKVGSPALPVPGALMRFVQTLLFGGHRNLRSGPVWGSSAERPGKR